MHPSKPESGLAGRWTEIDGLEVFYRESPSPPDAPAMMHVHGFGLSGRYLLPTAELLADEFHTLSTYIKRVRRRLGLAGSVILTLAIGVPAFWLWGHLVFEWW